MRTFVGFSESNDHEGETWNFYMPLEGNEKAIEKVKKLLATYPEDEECPYQIGPTLTEDQVDTLVGFANGAASYMDAHQKVKGFLKLPKSVKDWSYDPFYKGALIDLGEE